MNPLPKFVTSIVKNAKTLQVDWHADKWQQTNFQLRWAKHWILYEYYMNYPMPIKVINFLRSLKSFIFNTKKKSSSTYKNIEMPLMYFPVKNN